MVALANLHPPADRSGNRVDDLDSYMYQTIGHSIIPLYEQALGLPLYREEISGTHVNQDRSYGPMAAGFEDETEALIPLLRKVKAAHPEVNAVSTGAILSDYQRTRVESVATRLGLTPLAYLWQWPNLPPHAQSSLLEDMATVGQDSRIIKVASGGLDESFLWNNVADLQTIRRLEKAAGRFGSPSDGAVLGEGGEYETLAIAGPAPLWKGRILVNEDENIAVSCGAGAAYLQPGKARFEPSVICTGSIAALATPPLLENQFETLLNTLDGGLEPTPVSKKEPRTVLSKYDVAGPSDHILLSDLTGDGPTPSQQAAVIMDKADKLLRSSGHSVSDIAYTSVILRDMGDFASINDVYGSYFNLPNPPARLTIACAGVLCEGNDVMISLTSVKQRGSYDRTGLHIQSRSYWAPANIGPYSQAISVSLEIDERSENDSVVYIAGQIPLVPSTMELPGAADIQGTQPFAFETVLALQHYARIRRTMRVRQCAAAIAFITASSPDDARIRSNLARQAWEGLHCLETTHAYEDDASDSDSESFDIWDVRFGNAKQSDKHLAMRTGLSSQGRGHTVACAPLYVIQVDALPRGASIEWATYGLTEAGQARPDIPHLEHLVRSFKRQTLYPDFK